jgi:hypothetical protein
MRFTLLSFLSCALVTALPGEDTTEMRGGPRGGDNNIGNGDGGGLGINTGGGDIGNIGVGVGGGSGGSCDPASCDAQVGRRND